MLFNEPTSNKPILLVFPFGLLSHYLRCLVLANRLSAHFDVRFLSSNKYQPFIDKAGFKTFDCIDLDANAVMKCIRKFDFSWINTETLEEIYDEQVQTIRLLNPVAVLGDMSPTLKMAAEKTGVTYISLQNGYMTKYYQFTRKISRTHPAAKYLKSFSPRIVARLTNFGETVSFYLIHAPFKKLRQRERLTEKNNYQDELEGDINLICDLPELFPLKRLPQSYKLIQPLYYGANGAARKVGLALDRNKKTIFVSMGSTGDWREVDFLNDEHFNKYNLVTAGDKEQVLKGAHVTKLDFVDIHEVFQVVDLVVCHGGNGTIYQALLYGIPLLCKTAHFEQEWNVDALERVNAGRSLDKVKHLKDYISLVDEWIGKKESNVLLHFQELIKDQTKAGNKALDEMAAEIVEKVVVV